MICNENDYSCPRQRPYRPLLGDTKARLHHSRPTADHIAPRISTGVPFKDRPKASHNKSSRSQTVKDQVQRARGLRGRCGRTASPPADTMHAVLLELMAGTLALVNTWSDPHGHWSCPCITPAATALCRPRTSDHSNASAACYDTEYGSLCKAHDMFAPRARARARTLCHSGAFAFPTLTQAQDGGVHFRARTVVPFEMVLGGSHGVSA